MSDSDNSSPESTSLGSIHALLKDMAKSNRENNSCLKDLSKRVSKIEKGLEPGNGKKRKAEIIPPISNSEQSKRIRQTHEIVVDVGETSFPQTFVTSPDQPLTVLDNGEEQKISYEIPAASNHGKEFCYIFHH